MINIIVIQNRGGCKGKFGPDRDGKTGGPSGLSGMFSIFLEM